MLSILAPMELGTKLKQNNWKKQGGYYLTQDEHVHPLLETRATLILQNDIPDTANHNDHMVPMRHSVAHCATMQISVHKPAESNLHYNSLPRIGDDSCIIYLCHFHIPRSPSSP